LELLKVELESACETLTTGSGGSGGGGGGGGPKNLAGLLATPKDEVLIAVAVALAELAAEVVAIVELTALTGAPGRTVELVVEIPLV